MRNNPSETQRERALRLLESHGIMRLSELKQAGVHYQTLARMVADGAVLRQSRGLYQLPISTCLTALLRSPKPFQEASFV